MRILSAAAIAIAIAGSGIANSQGVPAALPALSYADLADLALTAPVIAAVEITRATRLKDADAAGTLPGFQRFYIEATVVTLLRGAGGLPAQVRYLVDAPLDARGKPPKLKKLKVLLAAAPVAGRSGELRLTAKDGQRPWTPALEQRLRAVLTEAVAPDAPPRITGVASAFHVPDRCPARARRRSSSRRRTSAR